MPLMNWMTRTISGFFTRQAPRVLQNMTQYELEAQGRPFADLEAAEAAYGKSIWVYSCVNVISKSCARVPWKTMQNEEEVSRPSNPLNMLLARPNPFMSGYDMREALAIHLALKGEVFLLKDEINGAGQPAKLWLLDPECMTVVPHKTEFIGGYVYDVNGRKIPFEPFEIIHIKFYNPFDPFRGFGPTQALFTELNLEHLRDQYDTQFFKNGARLMGVIEVKDPIDDPTFERIKAEWKAANAGVKNAYKTAVLSHGAQYKNIGLSAKEIDHLGGRRLSRDKILAGYGVPPSKIGLVEDANRSNSAEQDITFLRETVEPYTTKISEALTYGLAVFYHPAYVIDFPGLVPEDMTAKAEYAKSLGGVPGVRVNEVREAAGLKPVDGPMGELIIVPNNVSLVDDTGAPANQPTPPPDGGENAPGEPPGGSGEGGNNQGQGDNQNEGKSVRLTAKDAAFLQQRSARLDAAGKLVKDDMKRYFQGQYDRITQRLYNLGRKKGRYTFGPGDVWPDDDDLENELLRREMQPWYIAIGKVAMSDAAAFLLTDPVFDVDHPKMKRVLEDMGRLITRINDTTRTMVVEEVKEGMRRGYTLRQIAEGFPEEGYRGIRGVFIYADQVRTDTIARTETAMAYNRTSLVSYDMIEEATGGVVKIHAVEVSDGTSPNSEPACQSVNGQVWSKEYADAHPVEHPNCVRGFIPLTEQPEKIHKRELAPGEKCVSPYEHPDWRCCA